MVVGGGASGALAALHLSRRAAATGAPLTLDIVEPGQLGRGVAYSTGNYEHRLNVPAAGMSVLPDEPGHFVHWLRANYDPGFPAGGFAPRAVFGRYLADTLSRQLAAALGVTWTQHRTRAVDLGRRDEGVTVTLADGQVLPADAVVLALGHGAATTNWVPAPLARSPRFVADPWRPGGLPELPAGSTVLLVGSGLTMIDVAINYGHGQLHTVSRHGLLPLAHVPDPPAAQPRPLPETTFTAASARRLVFDRIRALDGDWRTAVDSLRPVTQQLWSRLGDPDRRRLLAQGQRRWERARHRMAPELGAWMAARQAQGVLTVRPASVVEARDHDDGLTVGLSDGSTVRADLVINCTGRAATPDPGDDPLVRALLARGTARRDSLGLGFATDPDGRLSSATGAAADAATGAAAGDLPAWTLGSLRRGELWESTAIPEIRDQAAELATSILTRVGAGTREVA
ncbi:MAG TPA: FAD/NAD(P)-binding protein [Streptosporangiaceae bacterium]